MEEIGLAMVILPTIWMLYLSGSALTVLFEYDEVHAYRRKQEAKRRKRAKATRLRKKRSKEQVRATSAKKKKRKA